MIRVQVRYFASFAEAAGRDAESLDLGHADARRLYRELSDRHGFRLAAEHVRVATNDRFSDWDTPLADGDTVVFIPPVSGG